MDVRGYADFVPMGASATPLRGSEDIMWTVKFRDGSIKRFKFPTRTTPEGSAKPLVDYATHDDLNSQALATEPASLGLSAVPTIK
jgi:adenylylsulfate reductase subunit B